MKLIHNSTQVIALTSDTTKAALPAGVTVFQGTLNECKAKAIELGLLDPRQCFLQAHGNDVQASIDGKRRAEAAAYFHVLTDEVKAKYGLAFQGLSALASIAEVIRGVEAIAVDEADAPIKAELLRILRGE